MDYDARCAALDGPSEGFDAIKQRLLARLLGARRQRPELWRGAGWETLPVEGARAGHLLAFARRSERGALIGTVLLHGAAALVGGGRLTPEAEWWGDTRVRMDGEWVVAADLLANLPVQLQLLWDGERTALFE